jgi:hypothetical protein
MNADLRARLQAMLDGKGKRPAGHSVTLREYQDAQAFAQGCAAMLEASSFVDDFGVNDRDGDIEGLTAPSGALPPLP